MSKLFGIADLWPAMRAMYPEVEDGREDDDDYEHPMTAVGLILLSAALLQTIEPRELRLFTGYSREFISAIGLNMQNNKLWTEGQYDTSTWLSAEGTIDPKRFWDHIEGCVRIALDANPRHQLLNRFLQDLLGRT